MSSPPTTSIATSDAASITVRGKDLVQDLIGHRSFTEVLYFLLTNRMPDQGQARILDACLVTLMEHGLTPSSIITRIIADNVPGESQVAISAGLLACGSVFVGTMEDCARILDAGLKSRETADKYARRVVTEHLAAGRYLPGFGHPIHKPDDPRTPRLFQVAEETGYRGPYVELLLRIGEELDRQRHGHQTINATGAIGALLLEIGIPTDAIRGIAVVSRSGGLLGHVIEERESRTGRYIWKLVSDAIPYSPPPETDGSADPR